MEEAKVLEAVTGYLKRETNCKGIALFRLTAEGHTRIPTAVDLDPEVVEVLVDAQRLFASDGEDNQVVRFIPKSGATSDSLIFQFHSVEEARYAVVAISPTLSSSFEEISSQLRLLDAQVQMTSRTIQAYKGVKGLIYVDEPTGLHNTRFFHKTLESLFERWDARNPDSSQGFSVLFLDVDKFKLVNDKHGHLVGTKILFEMAQIIRRCIRKTDFAFRYGGDEFVMILDGAKTSVAGLIAERIRSEVEHAEFLAREGLHIRLTVSIGVANCPEHAVTKKEIIEAADNAMYSVKRTTRNRVYIPEKQAA
jgi:diguanylate cyclase (GGDEF)-like protein